MNEQQQREYQQMMDRAYAQQATQDPLIGRKVHHKRWNIVGTIIEVDRTHSPENPWITIESEGRSQSGTLNTVSQEWHLP